MSLVKVNVLAMWKMLPSFLHVRYFFRRYGFLLFKIEDSFVKNNETFTRDTQ